MPKRILAVLQPARVSRYKSPALGVGARKNQYAEHTLNTPSKKISKGIIPARRSRLLTLIPSRRKILASSKHIENQRSLERRFSEERFQLLAANTSDGLAIFELGVIKYVSPSYLNILGFKELDELGRTEESIVALIHPDDRRETIEKIYTAIQNRQQDFRYRFRIRHAMGNYIWREDVTNFIFDNDGNLIRCYIVARDITTKMEAEEKLRSVTQLLAQTGEVAMVGGWELNLESWKINWTDQVFKILETSIIEDSPFSFFRFGLERESRITFSIAFEMAVIQGENWDLVLPFTTAAGLKKWIRIIGKPSLEGGFITKIFGSIHDITQEVLGKNERIEYQGVFENCLNSLVSGVAVFSPQGALYCNPSLMHILGYELNDSLAGLRVETVIRPEDQAFVRLRHESILAGSESISPSLLTLIRKDKSFLTCMVSVSRIIWMGVPRLLASVSPMAEANMVEVEIRATQEKYQKLLVNDMERLQTTIAQELHDSLGSQLSGVVMLLSGMNINEQNSKFQVSTAIKILKEAAQTTRNLAHGLLPIDSNPSATWRAIERLCFDFNEIANLKCEFIKEGNVETIDKANGNNLYRIAQEAISNALRHGNSAYICVSLRRDEDRIILTISDDGKGFSSLNLSTLQSSGLGIKSMIARSKSIEGKFEFWNNAGGGASISVEIQARIETN